MRGKGDVDVPIRTGELDGIVQQVKNQPPELAGVELSDNVPLNGAGDMDIVFAGF